MVKPNGLLVTVSSTHYCAYTSVLSTWSSSTALLTLRLGDLISRKVSRLYAFSVYPDQTSLPSYATGVTTGSQEVCSSRSSRTRDNPLKSPAPTSQIETTELSLDVLNQVHVPL